MHHSEQVLTDAYLNLPYEMCHYIAQTVSLNDDDKIIHQVWAHLLDRLGHLLLSTVPFTYQHPLLSFLTSTSAMDNVNVFNEQCLLAFGPVWQALLCQDNAHNSNGVSDHITADQVGSDGRKCVRRDTRKQVQSDDRK